MRQLRFFGAVAVLALLVATFAALSLLPNSVSAGKPDKPDICLVTKGDVHYHGRNVHGTDSGDVINCEGYDKGRKGLHIYGHGDDDILIGSQFDDHLIGGDGDDILWGGFGKDGLHGGPGMDDCIDEDSNTDFTADCECMNGDQNDLAAPCISPQFP